MRTYIDLKGNIWILDHFVKIYVKSIYDQPHHEVPDWFGIYGTVISGQEFLMCQCENNFVAEEQLDYILRCLSELAPN